MNLKVLVLSGYARSGKDSLYDGLRSNDERFERIAFADALKDDIDPFLRQHVGISAWTTDNGEKAIIRPMLVAYGEAMRAVNADYWLNKGLDKVDEYSGRVYVFTDARYENEIFGIQKRFPTVSKTIRIKREGNSPANNEEIVSFALIDSNIEFDKEITIPSIDDKLKETLGSHSEYREKRDALISDEFKNIAKKIIEEVINGE